MNARPGERIRVMGNTVGAAERRGTVLESRRSGGLLVRWDDGRETTFFPGSDTRIDDDDDEDRHGTEQGSAEAMLLGCHIDMEITETDDVCTAVATLMTRRGSFQATGLSRRNPDDPSVPMIGEELSIARALYGLADQLETEAWDSIEHHDQHDGHLI